ncbi:hypothetical protein PtB15_2B258 [Puccinia triticina]|nr:hypothetical protein PtB15_2B258 [Puccinia triticina]
MLVKNTGIHQIKQPYNLDNPNLYNDLCTTLWAIFSPQILTKTHITSLPTNPEDFLCLSDGESRIPDQDTLLGVLKEAKGRKVAHINLTYDHPFTGDDSNSDPNSASPKRYPTRASTAAAISTQRTMACNHDKRKKKAEPWALGPLAGTIIARGNKSLASKIALLSKPLPAYLNINRDGWVIAQRLIFDGIETTDTHTEPIVIKVNQEEVIGTGGMRTTYAAQVKTNTDGVETITDYVAKVMKNKDHQDLNLHATDARIAIGLPEVGELAWENNQTRNQQRSPNEQSQSSSHANRPTRAPHASSSLSHLLISSDDEGVLPDPNTLFGTRSSFKSPRNTSN